MTISAIIPTCRRPALLRKTIESVWSQDRLPDEILIGDDSPDDETEHLVRNELLPRSPAPIRFVHHVPPLGEGRNVDALYKAATGTHILHLHDDDPIFPGCIGTLESALETHPGTVAAFGLQAMIAEDGSLLKMASKDVNRAYFRTPDREGVVDGFFAGAVSMFPNNGFLIDAALARSVGYDDRGTAGSAVDYVFGLRLGCRRKPMVFVHAPTTTVRMTAFSESRRADSDNACQRISHLLAALEPADWTPDIRKSIRHHLPFAIANASSLGRPAQAWRWLLAPRFFPFLLTFAGQRCAVRLILSSVKNLLTSQR